LMGEEGAAKSETQAMVAWARDEIHTDPHRTHSAVCVTVQMTPGCAGFARAAADLMRVTQRLLKR
jgi:hypothetical protein